MPGIDRRGAVRIALVAGLLAAAALLALTLPARLKPFSPGEFDLLLAARSFAAGRWLPLWAGSVHPEATGTWMEAALLSPLLALGIADTTALRLLGALHMGLLVAAAAGLAARLRGAAAGWSAAGLLLLCPLMLRAHSQTLGTTVELAGFELLLAWAALESRDSIGRALAVGIGVGTAIAASAHALILLPWLLLVLSPRAWLLSVLGAGAAWAPWVLLRDPLGPDRAPLAVLSRPLGELPSLLDLGDLGSLLLHAPFALQHGVGRWIWVPMAAALLLAVVFAGLRGTPDERRLAALAALAAAPLLLAEDLMGYPAAYRYFVPVVAPAAVLLATPLGRPPLRARWAAAGLGVLALALAWPTLSSQDLDRQGAAFYAGQHRMSWSQRPLHTHALWLLPVVEASELVAFSQGYGLELGRVQRPLRLGVTEPERADVVTWLAILPALSSPAQRGLLRGLGLGLGEDGRLDPDELEFLDAATPAARADLWFGVFAAQGERAFMLGRSAPLAGADWDELGPLRPDVETAVRGLAETLDGREGAGLVPADWPARFHEALSGELPMARGAFGLRHPLRYARLD